MADPPDPPDPPVPLPDPQAPGAKGDRRSAATNTVCTVGEIRARMCGREKQLPDHPSKVARSAYLLALQAKRERWAVNFRPWRDRQVSKI
jgi:hypothetical protein